MSYKAVSSTIGRPRIGEFKYYTYNGDKPLATDPEIGKVQPGSGAEVKAAARQERLRRFAAILAELGYPNPEDAPPKDVTEAGRRLGVAVKTARSYKTALKQQRQREEARLVAGEDDGFSPEHAALVAEFESKQQREPVAAAEEAEAS